jgi:hypothetical protein
MCFTESRDRFKKYATQLKSTNKIGKTAIIKKRHADEINGKEDRGLTP